MRRNIAFILYIGILTISVFVSSNSFATSEDKVRREDSLRRVKLGEFFLADDRDGFVKECKELINYHKNNNNEKQIFDAYATLLDRLQVWGRFDEAMSTLEEMSSEAQRRKSSIGEAITAFCFGQFYLGNRQPQEALPHYRKAFRQLQELGETSRAIRAGFNLQAVAMNLDQIENGLALNDSTQILIEQWEAEHEKRSVSNRMKQTRYRFVLLQRKGDIKAATILKDSLLHYAELLNDPSQDETVFTALAQFDQLTGNKKSAYSRLDTLIARNLRIANYSKVAQFRRALADFQADNNDWNEAVKSYKAYAIENDSAQVHITNQQLNELTKKYELNELKLKNRSIRQRFIFALVAIGLLFGLLIATIRYHRARHKKNMALYRMTLENIHKEKEEEKIRHLLQDQIQKEEFKPSVEEKIYVSLIDLMNKEELFKDPNLNREELCSRVATNRTYLVSAITQHGHKSVGHFINHFRLRWAASALANDKLSVFEIIDESGFTSRSTFNRLFITEFGMSPATYRRVAHNQRSN